MVIKKVLFFALFFVALLRGQCFSEQIDHINAEYYQSLPKYVDGTNTEYYMDDGTIIYFYNGMPGCGCFYHCNCESHYLRGFPEKPKEHLILVNRIWHDFMKKYLSALRDGPFFLHQPDDILCMLEGNNPGLLICLPNEYLKASMKLANRLEKARKENIEFYTKLYHRPKEKETLIKEIHRQNSRASSANQLLSSIPETIVPLYRELIEQCPHKEPYNMILMYNRGLISLLEGNVYESLTDVIAFVDLAIQNNRQDLLTPELLQKQGEAYFEAGLYQQSIYALNKAIAKNPKNLEAYFHRASSYFEIGDFEQALSDYLVSKKTDHFVLYPLPPNEFIDAFSEAVFRGAGYAASEFIPSLCNTAYGLGECLWTFGECPIECIQNVASASYAMGECAVDYLKTIDKDKLSSYAEELVSLYDRYDQLSLSEKGDLIGYTVGKYGVEIFAGSAALKGVSAYKQLKTANTVCNFESMIAKESAKQSIISRGLEHQTKKAAFFENIKLHSDRQNKHIRGKHNYLEGKSIFEHHDAEGLLRKYAGKGSPKKGKMGQAGYQEVVDFEEHIGIWKNNMDRVISKPTTKGTIHYSKDSAHIVPESPDYKIWRSNGE